MINSPLRPSLASIVPENAPFTPDQRQWLNGFFLGLLDGIFERVESNWFLLDQRDPSARIPIIFGFTSQTFLP